MAVGTIYFSSSILQLRFFGMMYYAYTIVWQVHSPRPLIILFDTLY